MKTQQVHDIFESVADGYDSANDRISLGMHRRWKQALIELALDAAAAREPGMVLDVCCGTGDITESIAAATPDVLAVGLDFSANMLDVARTRCAGRENVMLVEGDALELPFEDGSFDAAVISFGLRNTPDYEKVVSEMARVVRAGGTVACLDASVPDSSTVYPFYNMYYKTVMPVIGGGLTKRQEYNWLYESTQGFLRKSELKKLFERCGLKRVKVRSFMFGAAALHSGIVSAASTDAE